MKVLIYTDLQSDEGAERCFQNPAMSLQRYRVEKFYRDLRQVFEREGCQALWDGGDTTDSRTSIPMPTIDTTLEGLARFPKHVYSFKAIGNHEQFLRSGEVNIGRMFAPFFKVVNRHQTFNVEGTNVIVCSYPDDDGGYAELTEWLMSQPTERSLVLGHFQVAGCKLSSGTAMTGISREVLERFDLVLLGHVHLPQSIGPKIHYIGSPFQQNFSEANEVKRVAIVDLDNLSVKWVPLTGFPQYKTVSVDSFFSDYDPTSEDRHYVMIKSQEEAERFYTHPFRNRAEAVYAYSLAPRQTSTATSGVQASDLSAAIKLWLQKVPPETRGIKLPSEDLVAIGHQVANIEEIAPMVIKA